MLESISCLETMQHRRHPPRKALHFPHPPETSGRVLIQRLLPPGSVELSKCSSQHPNIRDGQVHSLRPGRWNNVSGIARQKKPAELHGLNHKAPHPGDAFLQDRAFGRPPAVARGLPCAKFFPDPGIRPSRDVFIRRALQIQPGDLGRPHAEQREASFVIRVD